MHSPDHSTKGTPSALGASWAQWPLTAGKDRVSGTLSSPLRGAFHLSLTVLLHYRSQKVLSLGGWSPRLPTSLHVARGTQDASRTPQLSATGLSPAVVGFSTPLAFASWSCCWSYNPRPPRGGLVW